MWLTARENLFRAPQRERSGAMELPMASFDVIESLKQKTLIFCVTPGRSGTRLLCHLLRDCIKIHAEHEPMPRVNYVLRTFIEVPQAATGWLLTEKLPAIASASSEPVYAETSHLFCKGLIEAILQIGLQPKFIILARPASEVAQSLFQLNCIPGRTPDGKLVLIGPEDPGVRKLSDPDKFSDYQLCYWYAREIERRQAHYCEMFRNAGLSQFRMDMRQLLEWESVRLLAKWVKGETAEPDHEAFSSLCLANQNSRQRVADGRHLRDLPPDIALQEQALDQDLLMPQIRRRQGSRPIFQKVCIS